MKCSGRSRRFDGMATAAQRRRLATLRAELAALAALVRPPDTPALARTLAEFANEFLKAETKSGELGPLRPASDLHRALVSDLGGLARERGQRLCYLAPRGSAKS